MESRLISWNIMSIKITHYILVGNKRYEYTLQPQKQHTTIICDAAGIRNQFKNEEVPQILAELAKVIIQAKQESDAQSEVVRFRVSANEKQLMERRALALGFENLSTYLRAAALGKI